MFYVWLLTEKPGGTGAPIVMLKFYSSSHPSKFLLLRNQILMIASQQN